MPKEFSEETLKAFDEIRRAVGGHDAVAMISVCKDTEPSAPKKALVKDGPHEVMQERRDGEQFIMFDPRVMAAFRLGSKIIWWRMQEYGTQWTDKRLGDGLRFDLCRPRGGLTFWCFLRFSDMRYYFMGEIPEGQGNIERRHGQSLKSRKAY